MTVTKESYALNRITNTGAQRTKSIIRMFCDGHVGEAKKLSQYAIRKNTKRARKAEK
jgi:hypothetical protein